MNWLLHFFSYPADALLLSGDYDPGLVLLSLLIAIFTSTIAIRLAWSGQRTTLRSEQRLMLFGSSLALGGGVWAMHFIGMLAFQLCTPVSYDPWHTALSLVPSVAASAVAMSLLTAQQISFSKLVVGGVLVGAGIGTMHYWGMAAMQMAPVLRYDPLMFAASILTAVLLAMLALWARFGLQSLFRQGAVALDLLAGAIMGLAIAGMHYMGMAAARFVAAPDFTGQTSSPSLLLAVVVTSFTVGLTTLVFILSGLLKYRKLSRDARRNAERLNAMLSTAVDGIVTIDSRGIIQSVNQAAERIFGWPQHLLLGRNVSMLMPASLAVEHDSYLSNYLSSGDAKIIGTGRDVEALTRTGERLPVRLAIGHARLPDEDLFVAFVTDISARKQMELDLLQARDKAEQAAAARTAFVANMSHEIRTPMNAILGFSDVLLATELSGQQRKHLSTIREAARGLLGLLNDILDTARLEKGKLELSLQPFMLIELADTVVSTLWIQARRKSLNLRLELAPELASCYLGADDRIRQVLLNLVGNAIKFTEQGEVVLRIAPAAQTGWLHFAVLDTGIGIAPERLAQIFEAFTQADASTTRRFGGTGLGTTISKQLVELMGGRIWASSTPGRGSCFEFELPLPVAQMPAVAAGAASLHLPQLRILAADDVAQNLELLALMLADHQLTLVSDGQQALMLYQQGQPFDVALLDLQMPVLDGLATARAMRQWEQQQGLPALPLIALTASVQQEDRLAVADAGMNGFCSKPVERAALYTAIAGALQQQPVQAVTDHASHPAVLPLLDYAAGLARWGKAALYEQELRRFTGHLSAELAAMQVLANRTDLAGLGRKAHALRGVAANLSLPLPAQLFGQLEQACRHGAVAGELTSLLQALQRLEQALLAEAGWPAEGGAVVAEVQSTVLVPLLQQLLQRLQQNELGDELWPELRRQAGAELAGWQQIEQSLNDFDFSAAQQQVKTLLARLETV